MAKPLALTLGEPAGIGPDIAIKAWLRRNELKLPAFYLLGDRDFLGKRAETLGLKIRLADVRAEDAAGAFANALPVVATGQLATARPGQRPKGCFFQPRCTLAVERCANEFPPVTRVSDVHEVRWFRRNELLTVPRTCSTAPVSAIPAIPSFSPNLRPPAAIYRNRS